MTTITQSQIFFFISSVGFIILGILTAIALIYILRALHLFLKILKKAEKDINSMGDTSKEILEDMRDSSVFKFLFRGKKKKSR